MGDNPLTATQSLVLPGPAAADARGRPRCFAQPKRPQRAAGLRKGPRSHWPVPHWAELGGVSSTVSSLESEKHLGFEGNLHLHKCSINSTAACGSRTPSSLSQESFPAWSSQLWQVTPAAKAKKLNLWTAEVLSIHKITGMHYFFI